MTAMEMSFNPAVATGRTHLAASRVISQLPNVDEIR